MTFIQVHFCKYKYEAHSLIDMNPQRIGNVQSPREKVREFYTLAQHASKRNLKSYNVKSCHNSQATVDSIEVIHFVFFSFIAALSASNGR